MADREHAQDIAASHLYQRTLAIIDVLGAPFDQALDAILAGQVLVTNARSRYGSYMTLDHAIEARAAAIQAFFFHVSEEGAIRAAAAGYEYVERDRLELKRRGQTEF